MTTEVRHFVLGGSTNPYLLARVRWPDVAQAITAGCRDWQDDPGLFDLPYDPSSAMVTLGQAAAIAAGWGVSLPRDATVKSSMPPLIRRMPANWSDLAPAEKRSWSLEFVLTGPHADGSRESSQLRVDGSRAARPRRSRSRAVTERRHHTRVHVSGRAQIHCGRKSLSADLVDMSQGGMRCVALDTHAVLRTGTKLDSPFGFERTSESPTSLEVGGVVTWHRDTGLGTHFGVAFQSLNDDQFERVQRFLVTPGAEAGF